jgi:hypothetical protein
MEMEMAETGLWVPIFGIVFFFGGIIAIVALSLRYSARKLEHQEILKAIERGQELPTMEIRKRYNYLNDLRIGIFLIATGAGIMIFFDRAADSRWAWDTEPLVGLGAVPLVIGIGYIVLSFILKRVTDSGRNNGNGNGGGNKPQAG